jgi:hypothetical protein
MDRDLLPGGCNPPTQAARGTVGAAFAVRGLPPPSLIAQPSLAECCVGGLHPPYEVFGVRATLAITKADKWISS